MQHARAGPDVIHARRAGIINAHGQLSQLAGRLGSLAEPPGIHLPALPLLGINVGLREDQSVAQPFARHLDTIHHRMPSGLCRCRGQMHGEGRFAHRRTCGNDVQITLLPARRKLVEVVQTGRNPGYSCGIVVDTPFGFTHGIGHKHLELPQIGVASKLLFDVFEQLVPFGQRVFQVHGFIGRQGKQLVEAQYQLPADKLFVHHLQVIIQVRGVGHVRAELRNEIRSADLLQFAPSAQLLTHGENVDARALGAHVQHGIIHLLVPLLVEHFGANFGTDQRHGRGFNETGAQHGLFHVNCLGLIHGKNLKLNMNIDSEEVSGHGPFV